MGINWVAVGAGALCGVAAAIVFTMLSVLLFEWLSYALILLGLELERRRHR